MKAVIRLAVSGFLAVVLAGCTQTLIYHSVHWTGALPVYPPRACVEPALKALPNFDWYIWSGKQSVLRSEPGRESLEDGYQVAGKSDSLTLHIARSVEGRVVFDLRYYKEENPSMTSAGNALVADIGARCNIPDLAQRLHYEYRREPHGAPFWGDYGGKPGS